MQRMPSRSADTSDVTPAGTDASLAYVDIIVDNVAATRSDAVGPVYNDSDAGARDATTIGFEREGAAADRAR
jgi:hypothetical protein